MKRARIATYLANLLDHFDTSLYGFLVPILAPLFFPQNDPVTALIKGYGIVIIGLITRPLGAWYYSKKAQTTGPHHALIATIQGMTITTFCFIFLNTHSEWGAYGAIGLCTLRGFQSFFGAGEVSIAGLYVLEGAKYEEQHQVTSMYLSSQMAGILLAGTAASLIFYSPNPELYWKWPFFGSLITGASGWWLRKQYTPTFSPKQKHEKPKTNWQGVFKVAIVSGFSYVLYSASFLFFNNFAALLTNTPMPKIMALNTSLMVFDLILLVVVGRLFRNMNCKPLLKTIIIISVVAIPLTFAYLQYLDFIGICAIKIIIISLGVSFCIPMHRWYWQEFSPNNRYKTTAIGYAIGSETLGRTFPTVGLAIWQYTNSPIMPGLYVSLIGIFALLALSAGKPDKGIQ